MAIIVDNDTKLVVQGLTGSEGRFHGLRNRAYGTNVVAGVTPGKGGQGVEGIPVFDTVVDAVEQAGATVVTADPAPGMRADTTAPAEELPFAENSFDAVACRLAAHHFADVLAAVKEMTRVAKHRVVICDNTFVSESSEEADRLRDPSHVRNYSQPEWESFFELAGLRAAAAQAHPLRACGGPPRHGAHRDPDRRPEALPRRAHLRREPHSQRRRRRRGRGHPVRRDRAGQPDRRRVKA